LVKGKNIKTKTFGKHVKKKKEKQIETSKKTKRGAKPR